MDAKKTLQQRLDERVGGVDANLLKREVAVYFDACWASLNWTVDELLINPQDSIKFCATVRKSCSSLLLVPDDLILRALLNLRRSGFGSTGQQRPLNRRAEERREVRREKMRAKLGLE